MLRNTYPFIENIKKIIRGAGRGDAGLYSKHSRGRGKRISEFQMSLVCRVRPVSKQDVWLG